MADDPRNAVILEHNGAELKAPGSASEYARDLERRLKRVDERVRELIRTDEGRLVELQAATELRREQEREIAWWRGNRMNLARAKTGYAGGLEGYIFPGWR